jgi:hypothetical protein
MGLIKKIDVDKHFAARRAMRLGRTGPLSQVGAHVEPSAKAKSAAVFIEDVTATPLATDADGTRVPTILRSRQA